MTWRNSGWREQTAHAFILYRREKKGELFNSAVKSVCFKALKVNSGYDRVE